MIPTGFRLAAFLLLLSLSSNSAYPFSSKAEFKGRIIAYRPADRMQVASFAANRELLLFETVDTNGKLLKLVYVHQGYSDLKEDVIQGKRTILIRARRVSSCDQSLKSFEKDAPSIPIQGDSGTSTERLVFTQDRSSYADSIRLKCYVLDQWELFNPETPLR